MVQLTPLQAFGESLNGANGNPLPGALPDGSLGAAYNAPLTAFMSLTIFTNCGVRVLPFSVSSGQLPPGLSFGSVSNPDGITADPGITGTPTSGGIYEFTVKMNFSNGDSFSHAYKAS